MDRSTRNGETAWRAVPGGVHGGCCCGAHHLGSSPRSLGHTQLGVAGAQHKLCDRSEGKPVLLVHGFGASLGQFRKNIPELAKSNKVYAIDLLGFGGSSKPTDLKFTMQVWCDQLVAFVQDVVQADCGDQSVVIVGNSIGSLAGMMAETVLPEDTVRGLCLLNCAVGMNNKAGSGDWRITLAMPIFFLIDLILKSPLGKIIFEKVRQRETLKGALQSIYCSTESVDDELVEMFYQPACEEGAQEVFVNIYTGPEGGPSPLEVLPKVKAPILTLWGDGDVLSPVDGPVGSVFSILPESRPNTQFELLPGVGHCLHDDQPELVHEKLVPWLAELP